MLHRLVLKLSLLVFAKVRSVLTTLSLILK